MQYLTCADPGENNGDRQERTELVMVKLDFLNSEMIMSVIQMAQVQVTAYREFLKLCNGDVAEAARQTAIYISAMINPVTRQKDDAGGKNEK